MSFAAMISACLRVAHGPLCANRKYVINVSQCYYRGEPIDRASAMCIWWIGRVVPEICLRTDRQTDKHTNMPRPVADGQTHRSAWSLYRQSPPEVADKLTSSWRQSQSFSLALEHFQQFVISSRTAVAVRGQQLNCGCKTRTRPTLAKLM